MLKRTLTAVILIPPVLYLIGWSPKWLFLLAVAVAIVLAMREYFGLCRSLGLRAFPEAGYLGALAFCAIQIPRGGYALAALGLLLGLLLLVPAGGLNMEFKDYLAGVSVTLFGILYIGLTLSSLVPVRFYAVESTGRPAGAWAAAPHAWLGTGSAFILLLFVVIWAGDICAYLVGRSMGRTPFFARISPRKTWEGALAGLLGSLLAAAAIGHWFLKTVDLKTVMLIGAWIAVAGQVGDLVESAIKRGAGQKDSGTLLPGHGGFLDRIDSLLFGAPALWLALYCLGLFS